MGWSVSHKFGVGLKCGPRADEMHTRRGVYEYLTRIHGGRSKMRKCHRYSKYCNVGVL